MSKLTEIYHEIENQLQWGPALAPFFQELMKEIDLLKGSKGTIEPVKIEEKPTVDTEARQSAVDAHNEITSLKETITTLVSSHEELQNALLHVLSNKSEVQQDPPDGQEQTQDSLTPPATSSTAATVQTAIDLPAST
jgi:hypothetical protein